MTSGIYKITNKINNKLYIGSAISLEYRFGRHKRDLKNNKHPNKYLQDSWNKCGENNFLFEIIELCINDELIKREQHYIDTMNPDYNICRVAGSQLGSKQSEEFKKFRSEQMKGNKYSVGRKPTSDNITKMAEGRRKKEVQKQRDRKKIDYLSLDIGDWLENRRKIK